MRQFKLKEPHSMNQNQIV